jgi:hypothetical protein
VDIEQHGEDASNDCEEQLALVEANAIPAGDEESVERHMVHHGKALSIQNDVLACHDESKEEARSTPVGKDLALGNGKLSREMGNTRRPETKKSGVLLVEQGQVAPNRQSLATASEDIKIISHCKGTSCATAVVKRSCNEKGNAAEDLTIGNGKIGGEMGNARRQPGKQAISIQETDVCATKVSTVGNILFTKLLLAPPSSRRQDQFTFVDSVIDTIHSQDPPGRFLAPKGMAVLVGAAEQLKVWYAVENRTRKLKMLGNPNNIKQEDRGTLPKSSHPAETIAMTGLGPPTRKSSHSLVLHDNDVQGARRSSRSKHPGNRFFHKLISQHVDTTAMPWAIDEIIAGVKSQMPPGRFLNRSNDAVLKGTAEMMKVNDSIKNPIRKATNNTGIPAVRKVLASVENQAEN